MKLILPVAAFLASVSVARADSVDLRRFSIYQFKLYMTADEALAAARRAHFVAKMDRSACARDALIIVKKERRIELLPLPNRRCISVITVKNKDKSRRAELWFVEDFPQHPNTMRLYLIHAYEKNRSAADRRKLEQSLVAQYGKPTLREQDVATWCNRTEEHECAYSMEYVPPVNEIGISDFSFAQSTSAQLSGFAVQGLPSASRVETDVEFELFDVPYAAVRSAAIERTYKAVLGPAAGI